jgi:tetratricopeptide (TPR) repeat protein
VAIFALAVIVLASVFGYLSSRRLVAYRSQLSLWQDAVVHQPHDPVVRYNLGTLLAEAGEYPVATLHLEEAVRLAPDLHCAQYNLARALEASSRTPDAIEHYRTALTLRPDDAVSHYNLARLLARAGHTRDAIEHYRRATTVEPGFAAAHANLGGLLADAGYVEEAIKSFEAALRAQENVANYMNLATAYSLVNRTDDAIRMAEQALELARSQQQTTLAKEIEAHLADLRAE